MYTEIVASRSSRVRAGLHGSAFSPVGVLKIGDWPERDSEAAGGLAIFCSDPDVWEALASLCLHVRAQLILPSGSDQECLPAEATASTELGAA